MRFERTDQKEKAMTRTSTQQPEALRLAYALGGGKLIDDSTEWADTLHAADAALRSQHARIAELEDVADMAIKRIAELEAQLSTIGAGGVEAPASPVSTYVEVRECSDCGHVGINDADGSKAACNTCEWYGDSPHEDKCPGCNRVGTMSAACPKCGSRTLLLAETHLLAAAAPVPQWDGKINPADFNVETFRRSGNGWLAKPDNCVRITHVPTGLFEEGVSERSIHTNKAEAWERLSARLEALAPAHPAEGVLVQTDHATELAPPKQGEQP